MRPFRNRNRKKQQNFSSRSMLLVMVLVCAALFLFSLTLNITGGPLNTIAGYIFIPMQKGINTSGHYLAGKANDFKTLSEVLEENEELQKEVDELTYELSTLKLERYELENYRELYELDEKYPSYEKVAASVIGMDSTNWFDTFTIGKGSKAGIEVGMNVMAGSGLVGIVTDVGPNYAKVRSIIDDTAQVSGMVTSTQANIIIKGDLQSMNEYGTITFSGLKDKEDNVNIGDQVVTSYVSDEYHQGILIGYIATLEEDSNNLTKSGTITPVVDFDHLEEVFVILDKKVNEEEESTECVEE